MCEFCTVQGTLTRDLEKSCQDLQLLMLERMRMIDASNAWADKTGTTMTSKLHCLEGFLRDFDINQEILFPTNRIRAPPNGPALPLLWAMEQYVIQPTRKKNYNTITYNTARGLHTCLHQYLSWQGALLPEGVAY